MVIDLDYSPRKLKLGISKVYLDDSTSCCLLQLCSTAAEPMNYHCVGVIVISLPVFNEEAGIAEFLGELQDSLKSFEPHFLIVDDHSTDSTPIILRKLEQTFDQITVLRNARNCGHGASVLRGLDAAVMLKPVRIVTCDGDGQFYGKDIASLVELSMSENTPIIEGVRHGRVDPWFRRFVSMATKVLVRVSSGKTTMDANTPLRVISLNTATSLLKEVPKNCPVPNLAISALARSGGLVIREVPVKSRPPRRRLGSENHWKQKFRLLPSWRFVRFVLNALFAWMLVHRKARSSVNSATSKRMF